MLRIPSPSENTTDTYLIIFLCDVFCFYILEHLNCIEYKVRV